jgi:PST family polysaccharide transporter
MSTSQKRLFSNFYSLGIIQGTNYLLPLLITPYVIMRIGADGFGVVAVAQVVMTFLQTISDYGFNLTATRDVSLNRDNPEKLSRIFYTVLSTKLLIVSVLLVGLVAVLLCVPSLRSYFILYMLSFASVIGQSLLMNWLFQGIERMKVVMYISLFARLVFVALVLLFIRQKSDYIYFLFFTGIGNILAGVVSIIVAFRLLKLRRIIPSRKDILSEFRNGWHITSSTLAVSSYMYINILALRLFTSDTVVGYYSIAEKIINAGRQILSVYFTAVYPQVCQLVMTTRRQLFDFFKKYYLPFLTLVLGGCFILFFFPVPIISVFLRDHRDVSAHYLRIMSFVPFIICLNIPAYQVLIAHDEKKVLFGVFAAGTFVNLILNISVVRVWGPVGTCFTILITECLVTIGLLAAMSINQKIGIPDQLRSRART